jgi:type I restriction enzyme S subunit
MKRFYREIDERSSSGREELLSVSHITGVTPRSLKSVSMFKAASYVGHKTCRPNDLVVNTMWAWMGALGVSRDHGIVSPSYAVYRPVDDASHVPEFVDLLLRSQIYISEYLRNSTGIRSSRLRLYPDVFLRLPMVCPPRSEQIGILSSISKQVAPIDDAIRRIEREMSLLREYRSGMTSDVVLGKIDVRSVGSTLPSSVATDDAELFSSELDLDNGESDDLLTEGGEE